MVKKNREKIWWKKNRERNKKHNGSTSQQNTTPPPLCLLWLPKNTRRWLNVELMLGQLGEQLQKQNSMWNGM